MVEDSTDTAEVVVFEHDGQYLLKKSCANLVCDLLKSGSGFNFQLCLMTWSARNCCSKLKPSLFLLSNLMDHFASSVCVMMRSCLPCSSLVVMRLHQSRISLPHLFLQFIVWGPRTNIWILLHRRMLLQK